VIGIVAGRLKEKFGRPAIVIALDEDGVGKGSGRSIPASISARRCSPPRMPGCSSPAAATPWRRGDHRRGPLDAFADFLEERLAADASPRDGRPRAAARRAARARRRHPDLVEAMEAGGPYGMGWPAARASPPGRSRAIVKADIVGNGHVRAIVAGDDGRSLKAVAFRQAETELGQALLSAPPHRKLWLAGRAKIDDWGSRPAAELHIDDAAWAD
jgi:single-stranded-DNA-specific exonuclease